MRCTSQAKLLLSGLHLTGSMYQSIYRLNATNIDSRHIQILGEGLAGTAIMAHIRRTLNVSRLALLTKKGTQPTLVGTPKEALCSSAPNQLFLARTSLELLWTHTRELRGRKLGGPPLLACFRLSNESEDRFYRRRRRGGSRLPQRRVHYYLLASRNNHRLISSSSHHYIFMMTIFD